MSPRGVYERPFTGGRHSAYSKLRDGSQPTRHGIASAAGRRRIAEGIARDCGWRDLDHMRSTWARLRMILCP